MNQKVPAPLAIQSDNNYSEGNQRFNALRPQRTLVSKAFGVGRLPVRVVTAEEWVKMNEYYPIILASSN
jgi:hypothetical protein